MKSTPRVELFSDGACRGNPGPGGWGVLLRWGEREKTLYGAELQTTNNRMELMAVIAGLEALKRPCSVVITSDSRYLIQGITEWIPRWRARNWLTSQKQAVKNADLWQRLDQLVSQQKTVDWCWVKGHSGHRENELADALANRAIDELIN